MFYVLTGMPGPGYFDIVMPGTVLAELDTANLDSEVQMREIQLEKAIVNLEMKQKLNRNKYELSLSELDVKLATQLFGDRMIIANANAFTTDNLRKAGYDSNPLKSQKVQNKFRVLEISHQAQDLFS